MENETKSVPQPIIHLNGSGAKNLTAQYREASDALHDALAKLPRPHGRDYYPLGDDAYKKARAQFEAQYKAINEAKMQIEDTLMHIVDQGGK